MVKKLIFLLLVLLVFGCSTDSGPKETQDVSAEKDSQEECQSMQCLIEASKNCQPATFTHNKQVNMSETTTKSKDLLRIEGEKGGKCKFYKEVLDSTIEISKEAKQQWFKKGMTEEKIKQREQKVQQLAESQIGTKTTCKFKQKELTNMLKRWEDGKFSSEDMQNENCERSLPQDYSANQTNPETEEKTQEDKQTQNEIDKSEPDKPDFRGYEKKQGKYNISMEKMVEAGDVTGIDVKIRSTLKKDAKVHTYLKKENQDKYSSLATAKAFFSQDQVHNTDISPLVFSDGPYKDRRHEFKTGNYQAKVVVVGPSATKKEPSAVKVMDFSVSEASEESTTETELLTETELKKGVPSSPSQTPFKWEYISENTISLSEACEKKLEFEAEHDRVQFRCGEDFIAELMEGNEQKITVKLLKVVGENEESTSESYSSDKEETGDCLLDSDCPEDMHCGPQDVCISNSVVDKFDSCFNSEEECESKKCKNCEDGHYACMHSENNIFDNKCVQCFMGMQCKEGYICKSYECVAS